MRLAQGRVGPSYDHLFLLPAGFLEISHCTFLPCPLMKPEFEHLLNCPNIGFYPVLEWIGSIIGPFLTASNLLWVVQHC